MREMDEGESRKRNKEMEKSIISKEEKRKKEMDMIVKTKINNNMITESKMKH